MKPTYEELERERNELAAQVARLRNQFPLFDDNGLCEQEHCCEFTLLQERKRLHLLLAETPPVALAALKAQWQAEAIDYAISEFSHCGCDGQAWVSELEQYAIKLRAQEAGDEI